LAERLLLTGDGELILWTGALWGRRTAEEYDYRSVLFNRGQRGRGERKYAGGVMPIGNDDTDDRRVSIERMIERYRLETVRRLERRAITLWLKLEARQALAGFEKPLERVH
jgi:hypothetical protein